MPADESWIFTKKAKEKLHNPDDLDRYVRVARPSVWVLFGACVLLIGGLVLWGLFGTVYVNVNGEGVKIDDEVFSLLSSDDKSHITVGNTANVDDVQLTVASISDIPLSANEAKELLGSDYLMSQLVGDEEWVYKVDFEGDGASGLKEGVPLDVSITADEVTPFEMAFGTSG